MFPKLTEETKKMIVINTFGTYSFPLQPPSPHKPLYNRKKLIKKNTHFLHVLLLTINEHFCLRLIVITIMMMLLLAESVVNVVVAVLGGCSMC